MPNYVTVPEVRAALAGDEAEQTVTAGKLADAGISTAIAAAESEVDARLAARYSVPFTPVPDLVRDITVGIACYVADLQWRGTVDYETEQDPVLLRHARAQRLLAGLADGSVILPDDNQDGQPDHSAGGALTPINPYFGRLFTFEDAQLEWNYVRLRRS